MTPRQFGRLGRRCKNPCLSRRTGSQLQWSIAGLALEQLRLIRRSSFGDHDGGRAASIPLFNCPSPPPNRAKRASFTCSRTFRHSAAKSKPPVDDAGGIHCQFRNAFNDVGTFHKWPVLKLGPSHSCHLLCTYLYLRGIGALRTSSSSKVIMVRKKDEKDYCL